MPRRRRSKALGCERGQAAVELVAALPLLSMAALLAWQLVLAGHTAWMCANAARVAARADAVGRDPARAARSALPRALERGLKVERTDASGVRVELRVPLVSRRWRSPLRVRATTSLRGAG